MRQVQGKKRKGENAERVDLPGGSCLGHAMKNRMTVIRFYGWGAIGLQTFCMVTCRRIVPAFCMLRLTSNAFREKRI